MNNATKNDTRAIRARRSAADASAAIAARAAAEAAEALGALAIVTGHTAAVARVDTGSVHYDPARVAELAETCARTAARAARLARKAARDAYYTAIAEADPKMSKAKQIKMMKAEILDNLNDVDPREKAKPTDDLAAERA